MKKMLITGQSDSMRILGTTTQILELPPEHGSITPSRIKELELLADQLITSEWVETKSDGSWWRDHASFERKHNLALYFLAQMFGYEKTEMYNNDGSYRSITAVKSRTND